MERIYKFTGKERDPENGYDYFGARYYDSLIGIWGQVEPLLEKYLSFSPYCYGVNNPIEFFDINGKDIDLSELRKYDKRHGTNYTNDLLDNLEKITGLKIDRGVDILKTESISINENEGFSIVARKFLTNLVSSNDVLKVGFRKDVGSYAIKGTNTMFLDPNQIQDHISGANNVNENTMGWGITFFHEAYHTMMGGNLDDTKYKGSIGDVEKSINLIRGELGEDFSFRFSYVAFKIGQDYYIPFSIMARNQLMKGEPPQSNDKFIKVSKQVSIQNVKEKE